MNETLWILRDAAFAELNTGRITDAQYCAIVEALDALMEG